NLQRATTQGHTDDDGEYKPLYRIFPVHPIFLSMAQPGLTWQEILDIKLLQERVWLEERMEQVRCLIAKEVEWRMMTFHEQWKPEEKKMMVARNDDKKME
ncbi:hypothetical protein AALO_G00151330, partial [Alosa alosa]